MKFLFLLSLFPIFSFLDGNIICIIEHNKAAIYYRTKNYNKHPAYCNKEPTIGKSSNGRKCKTPFFGVVGEVNILSLLFSSLEQVSLLQQTPPISHNNGHKCTADVVGAKPRSGLGVSLF